MTIIMKFGGTSMGDAQRIRHCAELVKKQAGEHRVVAVVSAMSGVTDALLELAAAGAAGNRAATYKLLADIRSRHEEAARILRAADAIHPLLDKLETLVNGISA